MIVQNVSNPISKPNVGVFDAEIIPDADRVIFGLRDTGYDFNTAIADIVDNSITANATKIDISMSVTPRNEILVYIADNGCGMDAQGLRNAMKYGSAERTNKKSLSKFGLGLKTASTAFCKCMSIISRGNDGIIRKIQWDLDYIAQVNRWKPKTMDPSETEKRVLESVAGDGTGTVILWEKVDRLLAKGLEEYTGKTAINNAIRSKKEKLRYHLGLTFQRFLDFKDYRCPNVEISLDMVPVVPIDPFCLNEADTLSYPLNKPLMIKVDNGEKYPVTLCAYVLPRQSDFSTQKAREEAKISVNSEGFYVYRENRLIHYGDWLGMYSNESHYSLLRVEFSFGAELDSAFNVDIKKSRILPAEEIIDWIQNCFIAAPRREANDRYRVGRTKHVVDEVKKINAHASSNRSIDQKAPKVEESKMTPIGENMVSLQNKNGTFNHKIEIVSSKKPEEMRVILVDDLEGGNLWKPCLCEDGAQAIKLNQSHPFYQKVYYPVLDESVVVTGIDSLLWAFAIAENNTTNPTVEEYYEDMRGCISDYLRELVTDLPDPENNGDEA